MDRFRYYLRVRYGECDAQKVVFNARYADYVDLATAEWLRALGFEKELQTGELDYQLVKQTLEWKAPARYDQVIEASVSAKTIGNTSFTLATEFRIAGHEPVIATAETVYVHVNSKTLTKQSLPQPWRDAFLRGAAGAVVDHAGWARVGADTA
ncbi:thioesterase family protein [Povalibacter sp.]|uniref:acyl-CoA thioesterase n=1 Tax=Povalibacter sp. TaxID=1962978 RepID=UPI002F3E909E